LDALSAQHPEMKIPTIRDIERSFTLQVVDRLWMDHIDALDVMRNSIHLRSIAQRDPLVEFKNEAFRMFDELKLTIQHYIVDELLKLLRGDLQIRVQQPAPQPKAAPLRKLRTNVDDIARASGQAKSDGSEERAKSHASRKNGASHRGSNGRKPVVAQPTHAPVSARVGRNDPCPCGSGKKFKKCHGA